MDDKSRKGTRETGMLPTGASSHLLKMSTAKLLPQCPPELDEHLFPKFAASPELSQV